MKVHLKDDTIMNMETNESRDVVVRTNQPVDIQDLIFGGLMILGGVWSLVKGAYKNGCRDYRNAEFETLDSLGLITHAHKE